MSTKKLAKVAVFVRLPKDLAAHLKRRGNRLGLTPEEFAAYALTRVVDDYHTALDAIVEKTLCPTPPRKTLKS